MKIRGASMRSFIWIFLVFGLLGCSTFSSPFTVDKMMKVKQGMSSKEILKMFGPPKSVRQAVCGGDEPWNCTTWEYGEYYSDRASFTFSGESPDSLILNNHRITRD